MNPLTPQRHEGETYEQYKVRRAVGNKLVKRVLKGRLVHGYIKVPHNRYMRRNIRRLPIGAVATIMQNNNLFLKGTANVH